MAKRVDISERDFLDEDPEIRGQKFVCLSFIDPKDVIRQKDAYFFSKFLTHFSTDLVTMFTSLQERFKDEPEVVDMIRNVMERHQYISDVPSLEKEFAFYTSQNNASLEAEYLEKNKFQTTIRGIKVRGSYDSMPEAENRVAQIKKFDKHFDVYVAQVGCWCPWNPDPATVESQQYPLTELNTLMKEYKENQDLRDQVYMDRKNHLVESVKASASKKDDIELVEHDDPWMERKKEEASTSDDV